MIQWHENPEVRALLEAIRAHRFYHQSFKVYELQKLTGEITGALQKLRPGVTLNPWFLAIVSQGTGLHFKPEHNNHWLERTRPILEAFFHAQYFLRMAVRYSSLTDPPAMMPSGWAALLCLYGLR